MAEFKAYVQYNAAAGMQEVVLENGRETVKILPDAGSNLYSYVVDGVERLGPVENFHEYRAYGTPVLFPLQP
jgi:galactose mutarotase-like enzyme